MRPFLLLLLLPAFTSHFSLVEDTPALAPSPNVILKPSALLRASKILQGTNITFADGRFTRSQ